MALTDNSLTKHSSRSVEPAKSRSFVAVNIALAAGLSALTLGCAAPLMKACLQSCAERGAAAGPNY